MQVHEDNLRVVLGELKTHFDEVLLVDMVTKEMMEWADMFVSAGGDGTFLNVASQLTGDQFLIGLNTDPDRSYGHLCARGRRSNNLKYIIGRIAKENCTFVKRSRIRVKMTYPGIGDEKIPKFALNDVYVGERSPTRLSYLELQIDKLPIEKQKSSGLLISTGSGSTAWGYHINAIDHYRTKKFMEVLKRHGYNQDVPEDTLRQIMNDFNNNFVFDPWDRRMKYITREPLQNNVFRAVNTQGFAKDISVRSLCWHGKIVMDGIQRRFNFDDGVIANFSINDSDCINSIQFVD